MSRSVDLGADCQGKTCFATYALARNVARLSSQRHDTSIVPFRCQHCGQWHTGTTRRAFRKMKTKR